MAQLDFFIEYTETELLAQDFQALKASQEKLRKALFARHGELAKKYCDLQERMSIIERNICNPIGRLC